MKNKLYKLNKKSHTNVFKKISYGFIALFALAVICAIPLSLSLINKQNMENNIQLKNEIPFNASDALELVK